MSIGTIHPALTAFALQRELLVVAGIVRDQMRMIHNEVFTGARERNDDPRHPARRSPLRGAPDWKEGEPCISTWQCTSS
jgi:hypothetical protein